MTAILDEISPEYKELLAKLAQKHGRSVIGELEALIKSAAVQSD